MLSQASNDSVAAGLRLHIGGEVPHDDWKTLNVKNADYQQDARDLSNFDTESVAAIYASHILEHFHYGLNKELRTVLAEWYRVLIPGGELFISVPDLHTVCKLFCDREQIEEKYHLMRIIYGGNCDEYDVHKTGFDFAILAAFLMGAGFQHITRVDSFGFFRDCSELELWDQKISLNVTAIK